MNIVKPGFEFLVEIDGVLLLKQIEKAARTCYKSEDKITENSYIKMIRSLVERKHFAMLEHEKVSVKITCDRGVSHELVRHRIASFAQESTRYCNYSSDKFNNQITVIKPIFYIEGTDQYEAWKTSCEESEQTYFKLLALGSTSQEARSVLPNSLKTEIVVTMNLREWMHFFELRACGTTGKPHPQMLEIAVPMLKAFQVKIPIIFDDLIPMQ